MYIERMLQINVATMATLGTLLLGMGRGSVALPLLMFVVAVTSLWLTDVAGWVRFNRLSTNVAAVAAFFVFFRDMSGLRGLEQVSAIGNFLVYLQMILMFQEKEVRTYGCLALLSLVQVVVAALFHQPVLFGVLLVVYLLVGLSALVLLFLHRERSRYHQQTRRLPTPAAEGRRWPLAGQEPAFADSTSRYSGQAGVGRELRRRIVGIAVGTLLLTVGFFFILPRWGRQPWRGARSEGIRTVGFSDSITLSELGRIIESPEEVLRVRFSDYQTGRT
ncbi:MAG: DUF3488 domain-containing protein, partial [Planctomycetota bacterium]